MNFEYSGGEDQVKCKTKNKFNPEWESPIPKKILWKQGGGDCDSQQARLDHSRALEAIDDCAGLKPKRARIDDGHQIRSVGFGLF